LSSASASAMAPPAAANKPRPRWGCRGVGEAVLIQDKQAMIRCGRLISAFVLYLFSSQNGLS
jgi:hypothetical protein